MKYCIEPSIILKVWTFEKQCCKGKHKCVTIVTNFPDKGNATKTWYFVFFPLKYFLKLYSRNCHFFENSSASTWYDKLVRVRFKCSCAYLLLFTKWIQFPSKMSKMKRMNVLQILIIQGIDKQKNVLLSIINHCQSKLALRNLNYTSIWHNVNKWRIKSKINDIL